MKLKLDDQGHAVLQDGMPVYVHDDGKEAPFDAAATVATIRARNAEAKQNRERAEAAEGKLKAFEGIEDPAAALKALSTVQNLDHKKLVDAGEVERLKTEINKSWQEKLDAASKQAQTFERQLHGEIVGGSFARSKYIGEKLSLPSDIAQAMFGERFRVIEGKLQAVDASGNQIFSRKNPGAPADFDEALEILVEAYPHKDAILKSDNKPGTGTPPGNGGKRQPGGKQTMTRAAFDALDPMSRMRFMKEGGSVSEAA